MRKNNVVLLVAVLLICVFLSLAGCQRQQLTDPEKMGQKFETYFDRVLKSIDATAEQKEKINAIITEIRRDAVTVYHANDLNQGLIVKGILTADPDATVLHEQLHQKTMEMDAFAHRTLDHLLEINALLTAEQRAELKYRYEQSHGEITK